MSEKTLTFGDIVLNKNELQVSKKPSALNLVGIDEIVVSDQHKHSDKGCNYFNGYLDGNVIKTLCIILP